MTGEDKFGLVCPTVLFGPLKHRGPIFVGRLCLGKGGGTQQLDLFLGAQLGQKESGGYLFVIKSVPLLLCDIVEVPGGALVAFHDVIVGTAVFPIDGPFAVSRMLQGSHRLSRALYLDGIMGDGLSA